MRKEKRKEKNMNKKNKNLKEKSFKKKAKIFVLNVYSVLLMLLPMFIVTLLSKSLQKVKTWAYEYN